jgi:hypothetical protein
MFDKLAMPGTARIWQLGYCDDEEIYPTCARFQLSEEGKTVPLELMPTGDFLKHMIDE